MKITCKKQDLSRGLATVGHAVSTRSTLPVLANLLVTTQGDHIRLSATNLEIAITCDVPAQIPEEGATTVPAKLLTDFVNASEAGEIELGPLPGGGQGVRVRAGTNEANIRGMDPSEFPAIPNIEGKEPPLALDAKELHAMIAQTTFAAATDEVRPIFTAVLVRIRKGKLTFAAADTFRLAVRTMDLPGAESDLPDLLIPARTLNELEKILPAEGMVEFYPTPSRDQVVFRMPGVTLVSRLIEGAFPNFEAIMPKQHGTRVVMPTDKLKAAAKVSSLFARSETTSNTVKITVAPGQEGLTPGTVTLQATNDELGDATGTVDATVDGNPVNILFNIKYLSDVLGELDNPEVVMELNTPQTPGVIKPQGSDNYTYVIMPLYSRG